MPRLRISVAAFLVLFIMDSTAKPGPPSVEKDEPIRRLRPTGLSTFVSTKDRGDWTDPASWTVDGGVNIFEVPDFLDEVIIQAGDTIEIDNDDLRARSLTLDGVLEGDGVYFGHNFGEMHGSGTLMVENILPTHDDATSTFFDTGGVVYSGSGSYSLSASPSRYYNPMFMGSGTRTVANDLTIMNHLYLEDGAVLNVGNHDLTVQGNLYNATGATGLVTTGTVTFGEYFCFPKHSRNYGLPQPDH